ncbi:LamG-like jellyroll fold domain-containing protein [Emergencia timonensis]|uniref:LamG domain-containing protein n=1 Tax=Emergencia timonensis TaxID=1776384 RepID=UPI0039967602
MKENMVKEACNALSISNKESLGNYVSVDIASLAAGQYTLDVWIYIVGGSSDIISQENGIRIGIENEMFYFYHPAAGQKAVRPPGPLPRKKQWINLLLSYNGSKVSFALNGFPAGEIACSGATLIQNCPIRLGYGFHGYMRSFRCYNAALTAEQYKNYVFETVYDSASMTSLLAFIDFSKEDMPDISNHGATASPHGSCGVMNLVPVYLPSKGKFASVNPGGDINPGGFESGEFSVYVKMYLRPSQKQNQVIFSNGDIEDADSVILFLQEDGNKVQFNLQLGSVSMCLGSAHDVFQWVDVLITYGAGQVTAFFNGTQVTSSHSFAKRQQRGGFRLGNGFDSAHPEMDYTCEQYLYTAAVFDKKLGQADADSFLENHPYIFEDGLIALFSFAPEPAELMTCRQIHLDEDDVVLAQRTLDNLPQTGYDYRSNRTQPTVSDMRKWKAESIWDGLVSYYEASANLTPTLTENQKQAVICSIAEDSELLQSFAPAFTALTLSEQIFAKCLADAPQRKMINVIKMGRFVGKKTGAAGGAAAGAGMALTGAAAGGLTEAGKDVLTLLTLITLFTWILSKAAEKMKDRRKDKPDHDDDDSEITLSITSMSFQHSPDDFTASAVRCRTCDGSVSPPEWTNARRDGAEAVYIADKIQNVKVKVKFIITDKSKKPTPPYHVSIWAFATDSSAVFQKLEYSAKGLSAGVEYEGEFTVTKGSCACSDLSYQDLELWWNYTINGSTNTLANTKACIYFLPTTPTDPVYLDQEHKDNSVPLELLRMFSEKLTTLQPREYAELEQVTAADMKTYTDQVYNCAAFKYNPNAHPFVTVCDVKENAAPYTLRGYLNLFDQNAMLRDISLYQKNPFRGKTEANCNVYACMLSYNFSLHGVFSTVCIITSGNPAAALQTNAIKGAGAVAAQAFQFRYHAIVKVPPQVSVTGLLHNAYYDACCRTAGGETLANLAFRSNFATPLVQAGETDTYRGKVFRQGTAAVEQRNMLCVPYGIIAP